MTPRDRIELLYILAEMFRDGEIGLSIESSITNEGESRYLNTEITVHIDGKAAHIAGSYTLLD